MRPIVLLALLPFVAHCTEPPAPQTVADQSASASPRQPDAGENPSLQRWPLIPGETRGNSPGPMMPGRIYAPAEGPITCPSQEFEAFFHAFLNNGDLQVAYTAKPYVLKGPYYLQHNTEPGDPANPQWETVEVHRPMHDRYRYDAQRQLYVSDSWLLPGQKWTGIDAFGRSTDNSPTQLEIRQVSQTEYAMHTRDRITTFSKRADCWYLTHDWTLDPFEGCQWPDQCRSMREYEGGFMDELD
ncbi:hypothetical protein [Stenotrophomonas ginsengisoli]|nr:hypothetical protein [Stenotrophomonas ginsengisoli]